MNIHEFAKKLNGREYRHEIGAIEVLEAEKLGFVVVFGYSDDNAEFRGAIDDEIGCYGGGIIYLDKNGILEECECGCKHYESAKGKCKIIAAVWCGNEDYAWSYETSIPHATFDIMDDGEKYCKGIIFDIKELQS